MNMPLNILDTVTNILTMSPMYTDSLLLTLSMTMNSLLNSGQSQAQMATNLKMAMMSASKMPANT